MPKDTNLLPTPPIGFHVRWRDPGGKYVAPAVVIENDEYSPGIVILSVNRGTKLVRVDTVHWAEHPDIQDMTGGGQRGTWEYMPNTKIPASHLELHKRTLELTAENQKKQQEYIAEQRKIAEEAASRPVDPLELEVARIRADAILNG